LSISELITEALRLATEVEELTIEGREYQWDAAPIPASREDVRIKGTGGTPNDPTSSTAMDGRRLRLRAAVVKAERELEQTVANLRRAHTDLTRALDAWHGDLAKVEYTTRTVDE
jgi:hypothetical protein